MELARLERPDDLAVQHGLACVKVARQVGRGSVGPLHDNVWRHIQERKVDVSEQDTVSTDDSHEVHITLGAKSVEVVVHTEGTDDDSDAEEEVLCYSPNSPPQTPHTLPCHNAFAPLPDYQEDDREVITISDSSGDELSEELPCEGGSEEVDDDAYESEDVDSDEDVESVLDDECEEQPAGETVTWGCKITKVKERKLCVLH